jgi:hypothetical protein
MSSEQLAAWKDDSVNEEQAQQLRKLAQEWRGHAPGQGTPGCSSPGFSLLWATGEPVTMPGEDLPYTGCAVALGGVQERAYGAGDAGRAAATPGRRSGRRHR